MSALQGILNQLIAGDLLSAEQMHEVVSSIMDGNADPLQTAGFLTILAARGETATEFAGAARAMRERVTRIRERGTGLLDTCGTGGSGLKTFNISTAAAIVCAAAGVPVAKHGNRSITSTTGSADVLEQLGVNINLTATQVNDCINQIGIGFCYAPLLHAAMKNVGPIRKALGIRTIFNMLGPLTNPAGAEFQVLGTIRNDLAEKLARALSILGTRRAAVVCGNNELDEFCLWGSNQIYLIEQDEVKSLELTAADLNLPEIELKDIQVATAEQSAELIRRIFSGSQLPGRQMIIANTAIGLWITGRVNTIVAGVDLASAVIDQKLASQKLQQLIDFSQSFNS